MFGKYFDNRTHQHFIHTYSRVPHLDSQIFDIETANLRESRRIKNRTSLATSGLERAKIMSEKLSSALKESRVNKDNQQKQFISQLEKSQLDCLEKEKSTWQDYTAKKSISRENYLRDQAYLTEKLGSNSTKAASRIASVRRWD